MNVGNIVNIGNNMVNVRNIVVNTVESKFPFKSKRLFQQENLESKRFLM